MTENLPGPVPVVNATNNNRNRPNTTRPPNDTATVNNLPTQRPNNTRTNNTPNRRPDNARLNNVPMPRAAPNSNTTPWIPPNRGIQNNGVQRKMPALNVTRTSNNTNNGMNSSMTNQTGPPVCNCGTAATLLTVRKEGLNKGTLQSEILIKHYLLHSLFYHNNLIFVHTKYN